MQKVDYDGHVYFMDGELESGEKELDLMETFDSNISTLDDTIDLSKEVVIAKESLGDTLTDIGVENYD